MKKILIQILAVLSIAGCSGSTFTLENLRVVLLPNGNGALFVNIKNDTGIQDKLVRVSSPAFERIELHKTVKTANTMRMEQIDSVPVPRKSVTELKRGGDHIMLFDPARKVHPGSFVSFTFHFQTREPVQAEAIVKDITEESD